MMKLENVGAMVATRELTLDGSEKVTVLVGKPQPFSNGVDWYCPYQTLGVGSGQVRYAGGVDEVQALVLALSMIGAELYCSEEYRAGRLKWDCGRDGDLGFPVPENIRNVLPGGGQPSSENPQR